MNNPQQIQDEYWDADQQALKGPPLPVQRPGGAPPYFHILAKPTGAICNLDCKYCFFLSKEELYPGSRFKMNDETLENYIRQLIESQSSPQVSIAWQGGEPTLMGLEFFERVMKLVRQYAPGEMQIEHTLQTNGTLLDDAWCTFFKENNFLIGLSLDGPGQMHDAYRVDKGGDGTFGRVVRASQLLKQHSVDFNILCTVHAANADHPLDVYHFFRDEIKAEFIQFIPIVERASAETIDLANIGWGDRAKGDHPHLGRPLYTQKGALVTDRSVTAVQWGNFLISIFDEWVRRDVGKVFVQMFDAALASWVGAPAALCIFAETCGNALALEHNGDLYSCDHFVEPDYFLGNINQDHMLTLVSSEKQRMFGSDKRDRLPRFCLECSVRFACQGECPRNRFIQTPEGEQGLNYLCQGYMAFFKHIDRPMKVMAQLLNQGRAASDVMNLIAMDEMRSLQAAFASAKPDDTCPCGSGKIYRLCHGKVKKRKD